MDTKTNTETPIARNARNAADTAGDFVRYDPEYTDPNDVEVYLQAVEECATEGMDAIERAQWEASYTKACDANEDIRIALAGR